MSIANRVIITVGVVSALMTKPSWIYAEAEKKQKTP